MTNTTFDFSELLEDLDAGVFAQKVARALADTAEAVVYQDGDKKTGKVTLELKLSRIGESSQVQMDHKLAFTRPTRRGKSSEEDTTSTALYVGQRGKLSIMPDSQTDFFSDKEQS